MWIAISCALSVLALGISVAALRYGVRNARAVLELPQANGRLHELKLQSLTDSVAELSAALEVVANRVKMQRVRTAATTVRDSRAAQGEPDPRTDPEGWRNWKNAQLRAANVRA